MKCKCGSDLEVADSYDDVVGRVVQTITCPRCHRCTVDGVVVAIGKTTRPAPVPLKR